MLSVFDGIPFDGTHEIRPRLYLGGLGSLHTHPYTHILSVMLGAPKDLPKSTKSHLEIPVWDLPSAGLLEHFPAGIAFIQNALAENGLLLVHCAAGVSRSVTMVCAYLMATEGLTPEQALEQVRKKRAMASPNAGFLSQLALFHRMGCKLDLDSETMRYHKMEQLGNKWWEYKLVNTADLAAVEAPSSSQQASYRCRKCRRLVATDTNVVPASQGSAKPFHMGTPRTAYAAEEPTSLFVEPMQWMTELRDSQVEGKLYCPGCKARLGSYNWAGIQNESGKWICPGFQLHISRLDTESPQDARVAIRLPKI